MPAYHRVRVLPRARVRLQWCNRRTTPLPTDPYLRVGALSLSLALEPTTWRPFGTASGGVRLLRYARAAILLRPGPLSRDRARFLRDAGAIFRHRGKDEMDGRSPRICLKGFFQWKWNVRDLRSRIEFDRKRSYLLEKFIGYFSFLNLVNNCNKYWNIYREGFRMKWKLVGNFEISIINSCVQCTYIYGSESRNNFLHTHDSIVIVIPYLFHSGIKIIELRFELKTRSLKISDIFSKFVDSSIDKKKKNSWSTIEALRNNHHRVRSYSCYAMITLLGRWYHSPAIQRQFESIKA